MSDLLDYSAWKFLHQAPDGSEDWRRGDESLSTLWELAKNVAGEFSIDRLSVNGVTRWLLTHAYWRNRDTVVPGYDGELVDSGIGVFRVSSGEGLCDSPKTKKNSIGFKSATLILITLPMLTTHSSEDSACIQISRAWCGTQSRSIRVRIVLFP